MRGKWVGPPALGKAGLKETLTQFERKDGVVDGQAMGAHIYQEVSASEEQGWDWTLGMWLFLLCTKAIHEYWALGTCTEAWSQESGGKVDRWEGPKAKQGGLAKLHWMVALRADKNGLTVVKLMMVV